MVEKSFEPDSSLKNRSCDNLLKSCEDFLCGLPDPKSKGNNVSTLSTATFQSSHFEKDVFFVYDPDYDQVGAQHVMDQVKENHEKEGKQLKIVNFACRPPGIPTTTYFADSLNKCHYTCILVSQNFLNNLWYTFKTDMAIQNMLQNEDKRYTVIVIVLDIDMKLHDLPLELQTLSPILRSERYYDSRLAIAFAPPPFFSLRNSSSSRKARNCHGSPSCAPTLPYQSSCSEKKPVQESDINRVPSPSPHTSGPSSYHCIPDSFNNARDFSSHPTNTTTKTDPSYSQLEKTARLKEQQMKLVDQSIAVPSSVNTDSSTRTQLSSNSSSNFHLHPSANSTQVKIAVPDSRSQFNLTDSKKMPSKSSSPSYMFPQTSHFSDFPTTSRMPQEHSDTSTMSELLSSLPSVDYNRQASVVTPSIGLRNPIESDEPACVREDPDSRLKSFPNECNGSREQLTSDASVTLQEEILPDSFTQGSPSIRRKTDTETREKEQNDWEVVENEPASVSSGNVGSDETADSVENIHVEISDEELPSDRSISLVIRNFYQKLKGKLP